MRHLEPARAAELDLSTSVQRVAESPAACRRLLNVLGDRQHLTSVATELRWDAVRGELARLLAKIERESALRGPPRWM